MAAFDPVTGTATELKKLLRDGQLTIVQVVDVCLQQIERYNHKGLRLNALISIAPRESLVKVAAKLDQERREGKARSPLHGIPIVVKDSIVTDVKLGMPTMNGSLVFQHAKATRNAECVERLIQDSNSLCASNRRKEDGILGNSKPGGSSSGSSVAVAAGFAPLTLGTEAVGSLVIPANRASLYGLKLPPGVSPNDGVFGISTTFDGIGGMAKSAEDLALLTSLLMNRIDVIAAPDGADLSIGFIDPREWTLPEAVCRPDEADVQQIVDKYEDAIKRLKGSGISAIYPVELPNTNTLKPTKDDPYRVIAFHQFQEIFNRTALMFDNCEIKTVRDMVKWNQDHADIAMPPEFCPDQRDLEDTLAFKQDGEAYIALHNQFRRLGGTEGVDPVFEKYNLDILAAPTDSSFVSFASAAGYPVGCVPMSTLNASGRPFGICVLARNGGEQTLLRFMQIWEKQFPDRPVPKPAVDWELSNQKGKVLNHEPC